MGFSWRAVGLGLGFVVYNLPHLALPLAAIGLWRLTRRVGGALAAAIGYILVAHLVFAIRYPVQDQFMFFVPLYWMTALLAGLGLAETCVRRRWLKVAALASLAAMAPAAYAVAPSAVRAMKVPLPGGKRHLPYRDAARYWLTPWKGGEDSAERFARDAIGQLTRGGEPAILYADLTAWPALKWVAEVESKGAGVRLVSGLDAGLLARWNRDLDGFWEDLRREGGSLWVVSNVTPYCPPVLQPYVAAEPTGVLYRVAAPP